MDGVLLDEYKTFFLVKLDNTRLLECKAQLSGVQVSYRNEPIFLVGLIIWIAVQLGICPEIGFELAQGPLLSNPIAFSSAVSSFPPPLTSARFRRPVRAWQAGRRHLQPR